MDQLLEIELDDLLTERTHREGLACAGPLQVAAGALSHAAPDEISATTVVCVIGVDDVPTLRALVADIASEFGLDARIRVGSGSFSVRFAR